MPIQYQPNISYHGDAYTFEAISKLGQSLKGLFDEDRERRWRDAANESDFRFLQNYRNATGQPILTPEDRQGFLGGNSEQRAGIMDAARQRLVTAAIQARSARDPLEGQPQPLTLPDGSVLPGKFYIPGARSVIDTAPQNDSGPPPGLTIPDGFIWNGRQLVQKRPESGGSGAGLPPPGLTIPDGFIWNGRQLVSARDQGQDDLTQLQNLNRQNRIDEMNRQIAAAQGEIASGNRRPGPDWLPIGTPYADQVKKLQAQLSTLTAGPPAQAAPQQGNGMITPPPSAPAGQGVGGYIPGRRYAGRTYLGGDPNDPANWQ